MSKGGHNAGADLEKLCEPVSHMEMPLKLSSLCDRSFFVTRGKIYHFPFNTKVYKTASLIPFAVIRDFIAHLCIFMTKPS